MTTNEMSNAFTTLINTHSKGTMFGEEASKGEVYLDEYEKSVLLTMAQNNVVLNLYGGNAVGNGFEWTEMHRRYLDALLKTKEYDIADAVEISDDELIGTDDYSAFFKLPKDLLFITMEQVKLKDEKCKGERRAIVYPISQDEYGSVSGNPFRGSSRYKVLRMDYGLGGEDRLVELVSKMEITRYMLKYLRKPKPIVLVDLPEDLSIEDVKEETACELNEGLHGMILTEAVRLALNSQSIGFQLNGEGGNGRGNE